MLRGVFNPLRAITYIITQFAGAVLAASILYAIFGNIAGLGTTTPSGRDVDSFGVEILISFILITVILSTAEKAQILGPVAAIAVGGTFTALLTFAWNISGASANPWRTFGPTLISNVGWKTIWVYIVGMLETFQN
jgi:aquaporin Z